MISIITPTFNSERFIEKCIKNVINQKCLDVEHIFIDNNSTDKTLEIIKKYSRKYDHIRYISEKDKGQSDAMNKGIKIAKGEIISFLNVDDFYEQNTLNKILKIFAKLPEPSFVVGNCNIWADNNKLITINKPKKLKLKDMALGWYANHHPVNPSAYFYHKSIHKRIGYYDTKDNYALDIDFILRAVQHSNVLYINQTFGNYRRIKGTKTYESIEKGKNERLKKKVFKKYLKDLPISQRFEILLKSFYYKMKSKIIKKKGFKSNKKSLLIVYNQDLPMPTKGPHIRVFYFLKQLAKIYDVTLLTVSTNNNTKDLRQIKKYCELITINPDKTNRFTKDILNIKKKFLLKNKPHLIRAFDLKNSLLKRELKRLLKKRRFDYIQVEHSYLGQILRKIKTDSIKIIDLHNVHSFIDNKEKEFFIKHEKRLARIYDLALCCSEIDKQRAAKLGFKKIITVPNGVDIDYFKKSKINKPSSLVFIGILEYWPNLETIKYFLNKIYPLLSKDIKVNIIGYYRKRQQKQLKKEMQMKNVFFHGFVKDVRPFLKDSIFICPILHGGGTRLKILTAFSAGSPVISTSKGAEGISYTKNKNILIADSPEEFVKYIEKLMKNKSYLKKITSNARKLVESEYDWKKIMDRYLKDFEDTYL